MAETLLITGASRGIGRATAELFARRGANLVLAARDAAALEALAATLRSSGSRVLVCPTDVGDEPAVRSLVAAATAEFGPLNGLVCAAGIARIAPFEELSLADWESTLRTNLTGTFLVCKHAAAHMPPGATFVLLSSIAGRTGFPTWSAYSAAKFGLMGFAQALREELRPRSLRVTTVVSAAVDTPLWEDVPGTWNRQNMLQPAEVAALIASVIDQPAHIQLDDVSIGHMAGRL